MTSPDATNQPQFLGGGKQPKWADTKGAVPTITLPNALVAEIMGALGIAYDASISDYVNLAVDHSTGGLKVYVAGQAGGGGAVSIADGADVTQGAVADAAWTSGSGTVVALLKAIAGKLLGSVAVTGTFWQSTQPVSGTFWQTTQPVSIATAPVLVAGTAEIGQTGMSKTGTGFSPYLADAITTVVQVRTGAGKFGGCALINLNSAPAYLQCFDVATGTAVTLGTTVPTFVIPIPANSTAANGVADRWALDVGIALSNGLKVAATTTAKGSGTVSTGLSGTIYYG